MKIAIVTGSREWSNRTAIWSALDRERPDIIIHGACEEAPGRLRGADRWADEYARKFGTMLLTAPAMFRSRLGNSAGPVRNSFIVKTVASMICGWENPPHQVVVIAAPLGESSGTRDMMSKCERRQWRIVDVGEESET